ncbi:hypothetical protein JCM15765_33240 [Paradesulfitobacterium aromaticivorans]
MPISAKLFHIERYPVNLPIETMPTTANSQTNITLRTKVELLGHSEYGTLTKLQITHDLGHDFEGVGYSKEQGRIDDLIHIASENAFPAFVDDGRQWLISAYSSKQVFNAAFKRLRAWMPIDANESQLRAKPVGIDLLRMKDSYDQQAEGPQIKGGWFSRIQLLNVDVAYIGGSDVATSEDWDRYETNGLISAMRVDYPNDDPDQEPFRLLLTKDGSVFSYKVFPEGEFLKLILPIFDFAKQFITED